MVGVKTGTEIFFKLKIKRQSKTIPFLFLILQNVTLFGFENMF